LLISISIPTLFAAATVWIQIENERTGRGNSLSRRQAVAVIYHRTFRMNAFWTDDPRNFRKPVCPFSVGQTSHPRRGVSNFDPS
jgi:hypothetical protein